MAGLRIGIVGSGKVGKTSLMKSYLSGDTAKKWVTYRKRRFELEFEERKLEEEQGKQVDAFIVLFDLTNPASFHTCTPFLDRLSIPFILMGNKVDKVKSTHVSSLVQVPPRKFVYTECSAKYSEHTDASLFLLLDLIIDYQRPATCYSLYCPNTLTVLYLVSFLVTILTMLQGLCMCVYGIYFLTHTDHRSTDWMGVSLIWSGILTFTISFLGFYGTKEAIKEYLKVVRSTQYFVISFLEALYKAVLLVVYSVCSKIHSEMYENISRDKGFPEMMGSCLVLELTACLVTALYRQNIKKLVDQMSYSTLYY